MIQRLGRLNRRVTPENKGEPRTAFFLIPESTPPYDAEELQLAERWIEELMAMNRPLSQTDLSERFNVLSPVGELRLDTRTAWLDSGWFATPEPVRETDYSVSVILPEDEQACRQSTAEIIRRAVPINYHNAMKDWREWKNHLIALRGTIHYDARTGAVPLWK